MLLFFKCRNGKLWGSISCKRLNRSKWNQRHLKVHAKIYKIHCGHIHVTSLRHDVITSWKCQKVSPFRSFLLNCFFLFYSSADLYGRFLINCQSDYNETSCMLLIQHFWWEIEKTLTLTHDIDLHGVKVAVLHYALYLAYLITYFSSDSFIS